MSTRAVAFLFLLDFCRCSRWTDSDGAGRDGGDDLEDGALGCKIG